MIDGGVRLTQFGCSLQVCLRALPQCIALLLAEENGLGEDASPFQLRHILTCTWRSCSSSADCARATIKHHCRRLERRSSTSRRWC